MVRHEVLGAILDCKVRIFAAHRVDEKYQNNRMRARALEVLRHSIDAFLTGRLLTLFSGTEMHRAGRSDGLPSRLFHLIAAERTFDDYPQHGHSQQR